MTNKKQEECDQNLLLHQLLGNKTKSLVWTDKEKKAIELP